MGLTLDVGHCLAAGENPAQSVALVGSRPTTQTSPDGKQNKLLDKHAALVLSIITTPWGSHRYSC
eukprot:641861-Amphidinium_carterae.2